MPLPKATHTDLASYAAEKPMDRQPLSVTLLTRIDGVRISCMGNAERRGLLITIEEPKHRLIELALTRPAAIRNAVYSIIAAIGEPLGLERVCRETGMPPWFEFVAEKSYEWQQTAIGDT